MNITDVVVWVIILMNLKTTKTKSNRTRVEEEEEEVNFYSSLNDMFYELWAYTYMAHISNAIKLLVYRESCVVIGLFFSRIYLCVLSLELGLTTIIARKHWLSRWCVYTSWMNEWRYSSRQVSMYSSCIDTLSVYRLTRLVNLINYDFDRDAVLHKRIFVVHQLYSVKFHMFLFAA